ncbi:MAG: RnfABCDGE type electron transport complex subunit D [Pegethrix bostrychoides GSE-TBD4-15B]|jgi:Na+-transporting NADH:ubiquinone oxidoreductase subunit NqrB|uniref:RnfABCDGE type electron transport complex subunit D n=1 Tax=Pegethrix bostrychoides GSE-TBD4-15B TaxID=2839662 RepID=A0A951U2V6_9CYAN|nr:RnfABCDGE type electron transport complex subunit D [Pegethrix bostrychoides GSE-TBD4-15B]
MLIADARFSQIFCLLLFLGLGIFTRDWSLQPVNIGVTILTCLTVQTGWMLACRREVSALVSSLPSALITSLGLSLLLRAESWLPMALAGSIAISSKFLFRVNHKHLFNPSNFGIVIALTLTSAWVSPGQWGEESSYALLFLGLGGLVTKLAGRWDTTGLFLGSYAGLEAARNLWLGWSWDVWLHRLSSGSLLVFAFFMITDPRSIPDSRTGRMIWALGIAGLTFWLRNFCFISTAAFWALFLLAPLGSLIDRLWPAARFTWQPPIKADAKSDAKPDAKSESEANVTLQYSQHSPGIL